MPFDLLAASPISLERQTSLAVTSLTNLRKVRYRTYSDLPHAFAVLQIAMNHISPIEGETTGEK